MNYLDIQKKYRQMAGEFSVKAIALNNLYQSSNQLVEFFMSKSISMNTIAGNSIVNSIKGLSVNKTGISGITSVPKSPQDVLDTIEGLNKLAKAVNELSSFKADYENLLLIIDNTINISSPEDIMESQIFDVYKEQLNRKLRHKMLVSETVVKNSKNYLEEFVSFPDYIPKTIVTKVMALFAGLQQLIQNAENEAKSKVEGAVKDMIENLVENGELDLTIASDLFDLTAIKDFFMDGVTEVKGILMSMPEQLIIILREELESAIKEFVEEATTLYMQAMSLIETLESISTTLPAVPIDLANIMKTKLDEFWEEFKTTLG
jgi:hypothetical protein